MELELAHFLLIVGGVSTITLLGGLFIGYRLARLEDLLDSEESDWDSDD